MITQKNGEKKYITDVYYVPAMKTNIISIGQLLEKGYEAQMKNRSLSLKNKNGELVVQVDMTRNRLFTIDIESGEVKCMKTAIKDDSWLWHLRYGHLGFSGLKLLSKAKMVNGLPEINPPNQLCMHGKSWRARRPLEIVHTDIAGPFDIPSLGGNMYYLTFIDDYSRKCWVYVLKEKSEALAKFKEFKAMAEKQSDQFIKILRSDRGSEYTKNLFEDFCKEHGIIHQLTVRYTPQQNEVAERKNRTILDMARSIPQSSTVSFGSEQKIFWLITVGAALWSIWHNKNEKVFNGKNITLKDLLFITKLRSMFWLKGDKDGWDFNVDDWWVNPLNIMGGPSSKQLVEWSPPCMGVLKFNVDGAAKVNKVSCGGVLRHEERILRALFSGQLEDFGAGFAELMAIKMVLELFIEACWEGTASLIVKSDSEVVLNWLKNHVYRPWKWWSHLAEIDLLSKRLVKVQFKHVSRNCNALADGLAKDGVNRSSFFKAWW
ncbi:hypothetical protein GQ457_15G025730 [Hibiscus cannabinus]